MTRDHIDELSVGFVTAVSAQELWPHLITSCATVAAALAPEVQAAMLGGTVFETRDADLAALARSLAEPGLRNRIADYVASLKRKGIAT